MMVQSDHPEKFQSKDEYLNYGKKLFGDDYKNWQTVCPSCKRVQTQEEFRPYKEKGAHASSFSTECLGRYQGGREGKLGCDWAAYGFFSGPVMVYHSSDDSSPTPVFEFYLGAQALRAKVKKSARHGETHG